MATDHQSIRVGYEARGNQRFTIIRQNRFNQPGKRGKSSANPQRYYRNNTVWVFFSSLRAPR